MLSPYRTRQIYGPPAPTHPDLGMSRRTARRTQRAPRRRASRLARSSRMAIRFRTVVGQRGARMLPDRPNRHRQDGKLAYRQG